MAISLLSRTTLACALLLSTGHCIAAEKIWRLGFYWSISSDQYRPIDVPWKKYTHISQMAILPSAACGVDDKSYRAAAPQNELLALARSNDVKLLITLMQDKYARIINHCTKPTKIAEFVVHLAEYVAKYGYDGIDIDWESEVTPDQYEDLVRRLRVALPTSLLTVDIAVHQRSYVSKIQNSLDRISLMNYDMSFSDYHGKKLRTSWHNSVVLADKTNPENKSIQGNVEFLLGASIPSNKINLGVPFFGYAFSGCQIPARKGESCEQPIDGPGQLFDHRGLRKTQVTYGNIKTLLGKGGIAHWDSNIGASHIQFPGAPSAGCPKSLCSIPLFVTYSDPRALSEAVRYLISHKLGGVMTFALHQEFLPEESGEARYPLSSSILRALVESPNP